jgi:hypothetical protein
MKAILGVLLCYVFFTSQCFAIKGGPVYGKGSVSTVGVFSGVLIPKTEQPKDAPDMAGNSLGIFSLTLPASGVGSGPALIFEGGVAFTGTIQALVDPDSAILYGVIDTSFTFMSSNSSDSSGTEILTSLLAIAGGQVNGRLFNNPNVFSTAVTRFDGASTVHFTNALTASGNIEDGDVYYDVFGFKQ